MRVLQLKKILDDIPDNAEITHKKYLNTTDIALMFTLGPNLWQIQLKEYEGLPT